jgi:hypothetical protein
MSSTVICCCVGDATTETLEPFFVVIGRRASRRQIRAFARRIARAEGIPTTWMWTFRDRPPIAVRQSDRVEFMR